MDTTADYKALYLKKFFQWQDICHRQSIRIEELEAKLKTATNAIQNVANNVAKPNSQHSGPNCNIMLKGTTDD